MCDDEIHQGQLHDPRLAAPGLSRRGFGLAAAAVAGYATSAAAQAAAAVAEQDVTVTTPDGACDAVLYTPPGKGPWPGVLIWTDIAGLRPAFRDMGRRLASSGYVVLVPNPFYRSAKAPVVDASFNFNDPEQRKRLFSYRAAMTPDGIDRDATAYIAFLDAQPSVSKRKRIGVQGYCMGGALTIQTGALSPRIGAGGSFHGGTLVSKTPASPHLMIAKLHGRYLVCEAENDDKSDPTAKDTVKAAFEAAHVPVKLEVYPAQHGWCVPGSAVYNAEQAERAWGELLAMYRGALA
ncbi:MAG: dienelactone hydrolase family protein [Phenylobacterium sp.]|nr:MAG: dienelactone hydrolase family protein [Phenylobacterium sp.]